MNENQSFNIDQLLKHDSDLDDLISVDLHEFVFDTTYKQNWYHRNSLNDVQYLDEKKTLYRSEIRKRYLVNNEHSNTKYHSMSEHLVYFKPNNKKWLIVTDLQHVQAYKSPSVVKRAIILYRYITKNNGFTNYHARVLIDGVGIRSINI